MKNLVLFSFFCLSPIVSLHAEEQKEGGAREEWNLKQSPEERLPPVLPGEEVVRNGKTLKVWSTSGPVPVQRNLPIPPESRDNSSEKLNIIVDERTVPTTR